LCGPALEENIVIAVTKEVEYGQSGDSAIVERKHSGSGDRKTVYGEPIEAQGKTIIPVAKIVFGFGAGAASGGVKESTARGEGGGGGGGARAIPVGIVEVSAQNTRFVPITDRKKLAGAVALGALLGVWFGRRRRR
jgi:uncharacterized spore protein YtfJ